jgi:hypothetical protein
MTQRDFKLTILKNYSLFKTFLQIDICIHSMRQKTKKATNKWIAFLFAESAIIKQDETPLFYIHRLHNFITKQTTTTSIMLNYLNVRVFISEDTPN